MTKQEHFKQRVRARMAKTGERYAAARRALIDQAEATAARAAAGGERMWVSEPEIGDDALRAQTGVGWNDWCDRIDAWPGHADGHPAVAAWLHAECELDTWWSQMVTGGWERITGRRLPHQMADGTFTAGKSKTVAVDANELRAALLDADDRADLFPGHDTELRSKPGSKSIRIALGPGSALFSLDARPDGRTKVTVAHERLPEYADVEVWKLFWADWLDALDA